jgi:hypothetical protein
MPRGSSAIARAAMPGFLDCAEWIDRIAAPYAAGEYAAEAAHARTQYVELTGRALAEHNDDASLEQSLRSFLEWYVLERPLRGGATPIIRYAREQPVSGVDRMVLQRLATTHRSLFELISTRRGSVLLRDVVLGGMWRVRERRAPSLPGATIGDLFEARLIALEEGMAFLGNLAFFPREARDEIVTLCENAREMSSADEDSVRELIDPDQVSTGPSPSRTEILWDLARRRARSERYKHLRPNRFYQAS